MHLWWNYNRRTINPLMMMMMVMMMTMIVLSQDYHTERPPLFAAVCRDAASCTGSSATADTCNNITVVPYVIMLVMAALFNRGALYFCPVVSSFYLFSSPNLSRLPYFEFRMQVWNVLHAARWKCRTQKNRQERDIWAPLHNFIGYIFATKARVNNNRKQKTC